MQFFEYPDLPTKYLVKENKFQFTEDYYTPECVITKGFKTDGGSSGRWLQSLYPSFYKYFPAAAVHDFLYSEGVLPRKQCDQLFRDIMRYRLGLSWRYWFLMWIGVRIGGRSHYGKP